MPSQDTLRIVVWILAFAWFLLLGAVIAGKGAPIRRRAATAVLTLVSLITIVVISRQANRGLAGHYAPSGDDQENTPPEHYVVRVNDVEAV